MTQRTYKGCNITRTGPRAMVRWEAYCNGVFIAADTLAGMRQFITETLDRDKVMGSH